jgi:hypothetical protein
MLTQSTSERPSVAAPSDLYPTSLEGYYDEPHAHGYPVLLTNCFGGGRLFVLPFDRADEIHRDRSEAERRYLELDAELRTALQSCERNRCGVVIDWRDREAVWMEYTQLRRFLEDFAGLDAYAAGPRTAEQRMNETPLPCSRCGHQEA